MTSRSSEEPVGEGDQGLGAAPALWAVGQAGVHTARETEAGRKEGDVEWALPQPCSGDPLHSPDSERPSYLCPSSTCPGHPM